VGEGVNEPGIDKERVSFDDAGVIRDCQVGSDSRYQAITDYDGSVADDLAGSGNDRGASDGDRSGGRRDVLSIRRLGNPGCGEHQDTQEGR
jgi:hypothetical protein